jgi:hypothetical protein
VVPPRVGGYRPEVRSTRWLIASALLALLVYAGTAARDDAPRPVAQVTDVSPASSSLPASSALAARGVPRVARAVPAVREEAPLREAWAPVEDEPLEAALDTWAGEIAVLRELPLEEQRRLARSVTAALSRRVEALESADEEDELHILREEARTGACDADVPEAERTYYLALGHALHMTEESLCAVSRAHYEIP